MTVLNRAALVALLSAVSAAAMSLQPAMQRGGHAGRGSRDKIWPFGSKKSKKSSNGAWRQPLANLGDIQYTGVIKVGGQQIKAIVDTGSFELLAFGVNCTSCGTEPNLYDGSKSKHHASGNFPGFHSYGSGTCYSMETTDMVEIGRMQVKQQTFWEVYDADMPILEEDSFHAIFGVGPPGSAVDFAASEAKEVHKELKEYEKSGQKVTKEIQDTVDYYDQAAEHAKNVTSVIGNLNIGNMSVCLGKESGSDGVFIWNDTSTQDEPDKFKELKLVGDFYWSTELTDVEASHGKKSKGACAKKACSAVIDTGTSLIAAPSEFVYEVYDMVDAWMAQGGTCDDVSGLPDLKFKMNGEKFSLPPSAYVGKIQEDADSQLSSENLRKFMPHLRRLRGNHSDGQYPQAQTDCEVLIMTMDADSQFGPLWILGMPLFREYFTSFQFVEKDGKPPKAKTMSFSVADDKCQPGAATREEADKLFSQVSRHKAHLRVDASKMLVPRLVRRAQNHHATFNLARTAKTAQLARPKFQI